MTPRVEKSDNVQSATTTTAAVSGPRLDGSNIVGQKARLNKWDRMETLHQVAIRGIGLLIAACFTLDSVMNNWELIDIFGDGSMFRTPLLNEPDLATLARDVYFRDGYSPDTLSLTGYWQMDEIIHKISEDREKILMLGGGEYDIKSEEDVANIDSVWAHSSVNYCSGLVGTFQFNKTSSAEPIRLAYVRDGITFMKGYWKAEHPPLNLDLWNYRQEGYEPVRFTTDLRVSSSFHLHSDHAADEDDLITIDSSGNFSLDMYRFHTKSFCSGCNAMAEVGYGVCDMQYTYDKETYVLTVTSSVAQPNSVYDMGVVLNKSWTSTYSEILKGASIIIAYLCFVTSRKTVRYDVENKHTREKMTWFQYTKYKLLPAVMPFSSDALDMGMFCLNSDVLVTVYSLSTMLDEYNSSIYVGEVMAWNHTDPQWWMILRVFAIDIRKLWWCCALTKLLKRVVNSLSMSQVMGTAKFQALLTFVSGTNIYLLSVGLYFWPDVAELINGNREDTYSLHDQLDEIHISFIDSYYMRTYPFLAVFLILNIVACLLIDKLMFLTVLKASLQNTMFRLLTFNTTSLSMDLFGFVRRGGTGGMITANGDDNAGHDRMIVYVPARRLCTALWYTTTHLTNFGLLESGDSNARRMTAMKALHSEAASTTMGRFSMTRTSMGRANSVGRLNSTAGLRNRMDSRKKSLEANQEEMAIQALGDKTHEFRLRQDTQGSWSVTTKAHYRVPQEAMMDRIIDDAGFLISE